MYYFNFESLRRWICLGKKVATRSANGLIWIEKSVIDYPRSNKWKDSRRELESHREIWIAYVGDVPRPLFGLIRVSCASNVKNETRRSRYKWRAEPERGKVNPRQRRSRLSLSHRVPLMAATVRRWIRLARAEARGRTKAPASIYLSTRSSSR